MITLIILLLSAATITLFALVFTLFDLNRTQSIEIERLKNWRMVQDCKQQITDTALDMLFCSVHGDVEHEVRH